MNLSNKQAHQKYRLKSEHGKLNINLKTQHQLHKKNPHNKHNRKLNMKSLTPVTQEASTNTIENWTWKA